MKQYIILLYNMKISYYILHYIKLQYVIYIYIYCIILKNIILYHEYSRKTSTSGGRPATLHASEPPDRLLQSFALEAASHLRWMELGLVIVPRGNNYTNHQCQTSSTINGWPQRIPSGKHTKSYGQSPCLMGKSTISMAIFNSYGKLAEGITGE